MRPPKKLVDAIIESLSRGEGWSFDQFRASHRASGIEVWIANRYYGMDIKTPNGKYGGVVLAGWCIPWRFRVMRAVRKAAAKAEVARLNMYRQQLGVPA